jgi:hypothetical protein
VRKIISLFQRNYESDRMVRDEVVPGAEWVLAGEGIATRKYDGVCTMVRDGKLYKRLELKPGKTPPPQWEPADEIDATTGKQQGWLPVGDGPEDKYLREALENTPLPVDGTYEFLGPKSQGNVEDFARHYLLSHEHGADKLPGAPRSYTALKAYFEANNIEGIVWHHPDGRMVKIKGKDFGVKRQRVPVSADPPQGMNGGRGRGVVDKQLYYKGDLRFPVEVVQRNPLSQTAHVKFKNGTVYVVREDNLEQGPEGFGEQIE